jgi:hypothetical protein
MVVFFVALLLFCFTISNTATRAFISASSFLSSILVIWCIRTAWETTEDYDVWNKSTDALRHTRDDLFKRVKELGRDILSPWSTHRTPVDAHSFRSMADRQSDVGGV